VEDEILKDLPRTHTGKRVKEEEGYNLLQKLLRAVASIHPQVGYCQGMNYVAGTLLELLEDEDDCLLVLLFMLDKRQMKNLFMPVTKLISGSPRTALKELLDGAIDKIPSAQTVLALPDGSVSS